MDSKNGNLFFSRTKQGLDNCGRATAKRLPNISEPLATVLDTISLFSVNRHYSLYLVKEAHNYMEGNISLLQAKELLQYQIWSKFHSQGHSSSLGHTQSICKKGWALSPSILCPYDAVIRPDEGMLFFSRKKSDYYLQHSLSKKRGDKCALVNTVFKKVDLLIVKKFFCKIL